MSRLNKLIDEELEKTKPNNTVVLRGIDGAEIPEDNVQIEVIQLKSDNLDHVQDTVEKNATLVETISDLTDLLKKMRVEGADNENMKVVVDAVNNLTGISKEYDVAMEAYGDPDSYLSRSISTEGFLDVVKAIFIRIRDIIVGFFKAVWSFIKSLFTFEEKSSKVEKENKTKLQQIINKDLKLDIKDIKPIKTKLPAIVGTSDVQGSNPGPVLADAITVSTNYRNLINEKIMKSLSILEDGVEEIEQIVNNIRKTDFNIQDIEAVSTNYKNLIEKLLSIRTDVLTHRVEPGAMPSVASKDINDKLSKYKAGGISYCSLVDPKPGSDDRLALGYNLFAGYSSVMIDTTDISKLSSDDIIFAFAVMEESAKDTDLATTYLDPITDAKLLETFYDTIVKDNDETKFDQTLSLAEKVSKKIESLTKWMADKGYKDLTAIDEYVKGGCMSLDERLNEMMKLTNEHTVSDFDNAFSNITKHGGTPKDIGEDFASIFKSGIFFKVNGDIKPSDLGHFRSYLNRDLTDKEKEFLNNLFKEMKLDRDLPETSGNVSLVKVREYQELVSKVDSIFKHGINQLSVLIKDLVVSSRKTHSMFYDTAQKYINETIDQYR